MEKYNTEEIFRESQENVKKLNEKLKDIESLHNEIKDAVSLSLKNPILFKELAEALNDSAESYLKGNNEIFDKKIIKISNKITELGSEINRLVKFDFNSLFKDLETKFLENSKAELAKELKKFDEKATNLQNKIEDLGKEITRLSKIDLEEHFNKHQNKLSEVFISINGVNGILTNVSHNIIKITQSLGVIESLIRDNQKNTKQGFDKIQEHIDENQKKTEKKLNEIEKTVATNVTSIQNQIQVTAKKQQTNTYITWVLILIATVAIIVNM